MKKYAFLNPLILAVPLAFCGVATQAQKAYFIDGYHGGVYGHYPVGYTQFVVDQLKKNPFWKINLEIEPETWDSVKVREPEALAEFQQLFADQSMAGRVEYVSPAYGQSYLYNVSGESIIRHFDYGMRKLKTYFPTAVFTTYSSEEPCFTSALPQILNSFGYKYASLKNPNTCWGGYTRAFGGELVNWVGPDGSRITTVPRYGSEGLEPNSTWQTEGWTNSPKYINDALKSGIKNPVAMTLQDAGWKNGPWIGNGDRGYQPTEYKTWRDYFANASIGKSGQDWHFSQEDMQVSLVWGSQVLQKIAQQVRISENKIVMAEKMATLNKLYRNAPWPQAAIDEAWRTLMLSQHHDCWIVPYNGKPRNTWADKVVVWTDTTNRISDRIISATAGTAGADLAHAVVHVFNTTGNSKTEHVALRLPAGTDPQALSIVDSKNKPVPVQAAAEAGTSVLYFKATIPAMGFNQYKLVQKKPLKTAGAKASVTASGDVVMETDHYKLVLNKSKGGSIKSLVVKTMGNREFVDAKSEPSFNELRGNFFDNGGFHSTAEQPVSLRIVENGPLVVKAEMKGELLSNPYTQTITLKQGDRKIECSLQIDWKANIGIGSDYKQHEKLDPKDYHKPFYDDSQKLLALFPVNFQSPKIYKDAPFDVTESKLENTFFSRWDSIKHNLMVSWVDLYDAQNNIGLALLSDQTTSYAHGENFPLGLNVQYSGAGLWGRNHTLTGPTTMRYALVPHGGKWDKAGISGEALGWNEPAIASLTESPLKEAEKSLVDVTGTGYQVTATLIDGNDLLVRLFNAEGDARSREVVLGGKAGSAAIAELNGTVKEQVAVRDRNGNAVLNIAMPRFGIRTIRLKDFVTH
ncbi:alpha-mannosidase [Dyadobacter sp. SG02]|uniref:glycoside hydrolase family 38 C-terminal domain-containing protein n=1 Tax=Dyadobacter sp. SG02 TaxID=1855291 RepID=UPI0008CD78B6|nr:glycoside hydrolase family 38 C-terminal domain-containing protein [Dyadobacter sp. SG02]SEJ40358.1 alpha-mannosidase [Dyadobacter sp. SG02]